MKNEMNSIENTEYNKVRKSRYCIVFAGLILLFIFFALLNIYMGTAEISLKDTVDVFFNPQNIDESKRSIILDIRIPRMLEAMILGGALAVSGFLLQTFFHNPIAGPYVLGISSGAKMLVAFTLIVFLKNFSYISSITLVIAAFIGSLAVIFFILIVSKRVNNMSSLLVAGIMVGYICSAVTDFLTTFAADEDIVNLHGWSQGSFSGSNMDNVWFIAILVGVVFVLVWLMSKQIGAIQLGEEYAQTIGVNVKKFKVILILLSSILSACVTAFAGPISFIGIAVPFLIKFLLKTIKPIIVLPAIFLGGGVFCMGCDLVSRVALAPSELNISTVTSIFGAPIVIVMLISRNARRR
ncbi:FecCD family ABC transporter permease [Lachnobacterium bovis]|uniref:Iron complex transport system permease protein n=1 Tax=Lachnobacterium bovis TaxID=140626 RepID=A0A1H9SBB3_9FIRM|nr:iron ABC transporter permease [Lachnobacterium bovis]SER82310.1 iron complex transport system permease protein [Lachnobacterium bovis]